MDSPHDTERAPSTPSDAERLDRIERHLDNLADARREDTAAWLALLDAVNRLGEQIIPTYVEQYARAVVQALQAERRKGPQDALADHAEHLRTLGASSLSVGLRNAVGALRWEVPLLGSEHVATTLVDAATCRGLLAEDDARAIVRDALAHIPRGRR